MSIPREERISLIEYRIEEAHNAFGDAEFAANAKRWNMAANRLYYAIFYAASALLLSEEIAFHTHKGMISKVGFNYVKEGKLTTEEGSLISQLFQLRHEADYEAYSEVTEEQINDYLPQTKALIDKLISLNKLAFISDSSVINEDDH